LQEKFKEEKSPGKSREGWLLEVQKRMVARDVYRLPEKNKEESCQGSLERDDCQRSPEKDGCQRFKEGDDCQRNLEKDGCKKEDCQICLEK
jgi:hypothetical protein